MTTKSLRHCYTIIRQLVVTVLADAAENALKIKRQKTVCGRQI